jgi:hypothetical protein
MKRSILAALAAISATLALSASASALPAHLNGAPASNNNIHGGASELSRVGGGGAAASTTTGTAGFESTTTGTVALTFHSVKSSIGTNCTSAGKLPGEVSTTVLPFHLVMLSAHSPGLLITPNTTIDKFGWPIAETTHFATFGCGIFIPSFVVKGNGILGEITSPSCGEKRNWATLEFNGVAGVQTPFLYTGTKYTLESSINGGAFEQSALSAEATVTFLFGVTPELICTS